MQNQREESAFMLVGVLSDCIEIAGRLKRKLGGYSRTELRELMNLLDVSETDAIKAILNLVSPPPPSATRQNWTRLSTFGHSAPTTQDLWKNWKMPIFAVTAAAAK